MNLVQCNDMYDIQCLLLRRNNQQVKSFIVMWNWYSVTIKCSICCWGIFFFPMKSVFELYMNATVAVISIYSLKHWVTWSWMVKNSKVVLHFVTYIFIRGWNISPGHTVHDLVFLFKVFGEVKWHQKKKLSARRFYCFH